MSSRLLFLIIRISIFYAVDLCFSVCVKSGTIDYDYHMSGSRGPQNWRSLKPEWTVCSSGKTQSPVDIISTRLDTGLGPLITRYDVTNAKLSDAIHAVEVAFEKKGGGLEIDGKTYLLDQMHWHVPSEHLILGTRYAAEMHLVHRAEDNSLAVLGILYQNGNPDSFISSIKDKLEQVAEEKCESGQTSEMAIEMVDVNNIVRNTSKYYRYTGSLTTPPCTQSVTWTILGQALTISFDQVEALKSPLEANFKNNARPAQSLHGREIKLYE